MRRATPTLRLLGLLLAAALLSWWPLSSSRGVDVHTPNALLEIEHGGVYLAPLAIGPWSVAAYPPDGERTWEDAVGSRCQRWRPSRVILGPTWVVPLWVPAALLVLPWAWARVRRWRQVTPGRSGNCGYDLRATPDRCPACGAAAVNAG